MDEEILDTFCDCFDDSVTRIIVCGNKDFKNRELCFEKLKELIPKYTNPEIVSGHARGTDTFGEEFARAEGIRCSIFKAEWSHYGKAAGPIRNREMLDYAMEENPVVIAFWNGRSRGTKNMIELAKKAGAEVIIVPITL